MVPCQLLQGRRAGGAGCARFGPVGMAMLAGGLMLFSTTAAMADELTGQVSAARAQYAAELTELAAWAQQQGLTAEAEAARDWLPAELPDRLYLFVLPTPSPALWAERPPTAGPTMSPAAEEFATRRSALGQRRADALVELVRSAVERGQLSLAWQLAVEAVRENPDQPTARQLLGYQRHDEAWLTLYETTKARAKQVWDPRFGWLPRERLARYEQGQRYHAGRWLSAEQDASLHATIEKGWQVATEHYEVRTNTSLAAGAELAARLERLASVWRQLFAGYVHTPQQVTPRLGDQPPRPRIPPRYDVVYFADKQQYVAALQRQQPNIGITSGIYLGDARTAYFFADGNEVEDLENLHHEATHQLFSQTRSTVRRPGLKHNFWIIEGIACYLESLVFHDGYCTLGGYDAVRLNDARVRLLRDDFYVPLEELASFGIEQLQHDSRIAMLYSQSAGLTHFLMHYDEGRYREVLVDYLLAVYTGRDTPTTLADLAGVSFAELDRQYREFIESTVARE